MTAVVTPGSEELAAEFYAVEYSADDYPFSTAPQAERDLFLRMADIAIARLAAKPSGEGMREKLESDYLKAICNAGERCSCADKNWQWRDAHCDIAMAHVKAIVNRALSTTGEPKR